MVTQEMVDAAVALARKCADAWARWSQWYARDEAHRLVTPWPYAPYPSAEYHASGDAEADRLAGWVANEEYDRACGRICANFRETQYFSLFDDAATRPGHAIPGSGHSEGGVDLGDDPRYLLVHGRANFNNESFHWALRSEFPAAFAEAIVVASKRLGENHNSRELVGCACRMLADHADADGTL